MRKLFEALLSIAKTVMLEQKPNAPKPLHLVVPKPLSLPKFVAQAHDHHDARLQQEVLARRIERYEQLADSVALSVRPLWQYNYDHDDLRPMRKHKAMDGLIVPYDHPFWALHYPTGSVKGCHCKVFGIAMDELADYGKTEPDNPSI